jgi:predicted Zn-dependent protease
MGRCLIAFLAASVAGVFLVGCGGGSASSSADNGTRFVPNYIDNIGNDIARWSSRQVRVQLTRGAETTQTGALRTQLEEAIRRWNGTGASVQLVLVESGADIPLTFTAASDPDYVGGVVGITTRRFVRGNPYGRMVSASIKIKAGLSESKRQAVLTHELGHALGIGGHSPDGRDVMYSAPTPPGAVTDPDANTVKTLYVSRSRSAATAGPVQEEVTRCPG